MSQRNYVQVLDTKGDLKWPGFVVTDNLNEAFSYQHSIFRPSTGPQVYGFFERAYDEGGWTVYVDEVYQIGRGTIRSFPLFYVRGLTAGRSRGLTIVTGSQRPKFLPLFAITESSHIFVMELNSAQDRHDLARMVGSDAVEAQVHSKSFLYFNTVTGKAIHGRLKL